MKDGETRVVVIDGPRMGMVRAFPGTPPETFTEPLRDQNAPPGKPPLEVTHTTRRVEILGRVAWVASAYGTPEDEMIWAALTSGAKTGSLPVSIWGSAHPDGWEVSGGH